jgi:TonB family protein
LTHNDPVISTWERDLQRIQSGMPFGYLQVPGRVQLEKRSSGNDFEMQSSTRAEGTVLVNAEIAVDGTVAHTIAISGVKELQSAAAAAVKQWRFEPTLVNGKPVVVFSTFEVHVGTPKSQFVPDQTANFKSFMKFIMLPDLLLAFIRLSQQIPQPIKPAFPHRAAIADPFLRR